MQRHVDTVERPECRVERVERAERRRYVDTPCLHIASSLQQTNYRQRGTGGNRRNSSNQRESVRFHRATQSSRDRKQVR